MAISRDALITRCQNYANDITTRVDTSDWLLYLNDFIRQAATDYNLPWAKRRTDLLVYPDVLEYSLPSDFRDIIPPQLPIDEDTRDTAWFQYQTQRGFARNLNLRNDLALNYERGTKFLNIRYTDRDAEAVTLHDMDDHDANGTWVASGQAGSIATELGIFRQGGGSTSFVVSVAGTATITITDMGAIDITDYPNRARKFVWVYFPATGAGTVTARWGTDASNYYSNTATTQHNGAAFIAGWNLLSFAWPASATGTPTDTSIQYLQLSIASAPVGTYYIDHMALRKWIQFDFYYYSTNTVLDDDGSTYKESLVDANDQLVADTEFEDCAVFHAVSMAAQFKLRDADLETRAGQNFLKRWQALRIKHPNLAPRPTSSYFDDNLLNF